MAADFHLYYMKIIIIIIIIIIIMVRTDMLACEAVGSEYPHCIIL